MNQEASEYFQAQAHLHKHTLSYISSMSLKCAVQLGIPDIIHNHGEPITLSQLISALGIEPTKADCLYRFMRLLVHSGFFATTKVEKDQDNNNEAYLLTPLSKLLLKDDINSLSPFVMLTLSPALMSPWQFPGDWLQETKEIGLFEKAHGKPVWEYLDQDPDFKKIFHDAMEIDSQMINLVNKNCKPVFEGVNTLVDVGGGTGKISKILLEAYPQMKCTVFDFPHVVANLPSTENLKFVAGDLFHHFPSGDAILMKAVLHCFGDEDCIKILKRCKEALPTGGKKGKLIIIEEVINEKKDGHDITEVKLLFDVLIMAMLNGKERTEQDWEKLFLAAGFSGYKITLLSDLRFSLIEVHP